MHAAMQHGFGGGCCNVDEKEYVHMRDDFEIVP
jgi:hypothetical protein